MPDYVPRTPTPRPAVSRYAPAPQRPFAGLIDAVIVPEPAGFEFDGAIPYDQATAIWTWMTRDLAPDLIGQDLTPDEMTARTTFEAALPEVMRRAREALTQAGGNQDAERRLVVQLGGVGGWNRLPFVMHALKSRLVLEKAQSFGRATNQMPDDASLATALQAMPTSDPHLLAMMMMAALGQVTSPHRLVAAVIKLTGAATEPAISRAGYTPLVEAIFAHAQAQIPVLGQGGTFADIDLVCRAIDRFHRLMRSVTGYIELGRLSRWSTVIAGLTTAASDLIENKLRHVVTDVNLALRRSAGATDRIDSDLVLGALNGCYLLATVRDCRDSLGVNTIFEQTWTQIGQALETHMQRNLELFRHNPMDRVVSQRLDAAIKMAELRFTAEYADVVRKARDTAERRVS